MRLKADLTLFFVAVIWGSGFVAQRLAASNHLGAFLFNGGRFLLGALILLPFALPRWKLKPADLPWVGLAGLLLFGGCWLQQAGMQYTSAANAGFITGLYVVLVPMLLALFWRQKVRLLAWIAAGLAVFGIWLLSAQGKFRLAPGDGLELIGSLLWAFHVILVGRLSQRIDVLPFSVGQFLVSGVLNLIAGGLFELHSLSVLPLVWPAVLYSACLPIALGFTLQVAGQKHAPAADAAILLSMEAVFAALFGFAWLGEGLSTGQVAGCALMLTAMLLAQFNRQPEPAGVTAETLPTSPTAIQ
jgi:drug/metabolite transporter (DMT)-like permease